MRMVRVGKDIVTVKVGPADARRIGVPVGLAFDRARLRLFDAVSGRWMEDMP